VWFDTSCLTGEGLIQHVLPVLVVFNCSQLHSAWSYHLNACSPPSVWRDKLALMTMLALEVTLVFVMFLGLLRLRGRGGGMFGLGRLLWKQVK
jgi:hypothetical protein